MKINPISAISFKREYTLEEKIEAVKTQEKAMELLGNKKVVIIVPESSLPIKPNENIGVGQLNSKSTKEFLEFLKVYTGANTLKVLPQGEFKIPTDGFYSNYSSSGLSLGTNLISLEELTEEKMDKILSQETLKKVYESAQKTEEKGLANFENVVGLESEHGKALKEAYENFLKLDTNNNLRTSFERYKTENKEVFERISIFEALANKYKTSDYNKWTEDIDKNLFDTKNISKEKRDARIIELKNNHSKEIDFYYFKQFLADENLNQARKNSNEQGFKLMGDCLIGFSDAEIWAYPQAFERNANICSENWGLKSLNFSEITKEGSESNQLLKQKVKQFAKRYDEIRFDVGWAYVNPIIYPKNGTAHLLDKRYIYDSNANGYRVKEYLGDSVLKIIEDTVKSVKGKDYNLNNLIYEIEAGPNEFGVFDWNKNEVINAFKNRTIVHSSCYMDEGYGTVEFIENKMKVPRKDYVYMSGNHDHISLDALSRKFDIDDILKTNGNNIDEVVEKQYKVLAKIFNIPEETFRQNPKEFIKSKFSYTFMAENIKLFFMDVFGRSEQFDSQEKNCRKNYRYMIDSDYKKSFFETLHQDKGFNIMESLAKTMKAKNLDKKHPEVYNNLLKFSNILKEKPISITPEIEKPKDPSVKTSKGKIIFGCFAGAAILTGGLVYWNKNKKEQNSKQI